LTLDADLPNPSLSAIEQASLPKISSGPVDTIVKEGYPAARQQLFTLALGECQVICE
jgi:hypothetical protein